MYGYEEIRMVHLEITDKCNAACPQCPRNEQGGKTNPLLSLTELRLDEIRKIFPADFVRQLRTIFLCGNFGDASIARDTMDILRYFRQENERLDLGIYTNGGARRPEWWAELGSLLKKGCGFARFGIDGLEDTNHLYRRNVRWSAVMQNVKAFIDAGGNAEWDFIVFRHNEHQVEEAMDLASKLGFSRFFAKKTSRFMDYHSLTPLEKTPVRDKAGRVEYFIMRPINSDWHNKALEMISEVSLRKGGIFSYLDTTPISCKAIDEKAIFVSADGYVFPCCWLAFHVHGQLMESKEFNRFVGQSGGLELLNAKTLPLREIVEGRFFKSDVPKSWAKKSVSEGRIKTCAGMCGKELNYWYLEQQQKRLL